MVEFIKYGSYFFCEWFLLEHSFQLVLLSSLGAVLLWYLFRGQKPRAVPLTWEEEEEIVKNFEPEPLVPDVVPEKSYRRRVVQSRAGKKVTVDGEECLNLATHNYLGYVDDAEVTRRAADCISKYGVGSCGPRGFYGTADVHLELEERLAEFMGVEEACVYSYGFSTAASAIPAYCKRRDIIFADEAVNFAIQKGFDASRSQVKYFRHNDMAHLEELLREHDAAEQALRGKARVRRFLVVEGIYVNTGTMCPLVQLVALRNKYQLRMFLDETISIGTIGATGRGVVEYFNVPHEELDLRIGSMEGALASVGGFCCGTTFIVEHQRLNGLGYCFSASLPPLLAVAALTSLSQLRADPARIETLNKVSVELHKALADLPGLELSGHELSPVKHLRLLNSLSYSADLVKLQSLADSCFKRRLAVVPPSLLEHVEKFPPRASLRVVANSLLDQQDIEFVQRVLGESCRDVLLADLHVEE